MYYTSSNVIIFFCFESADGLFLFWSGLFLVFYAVMSWMSLSCVFCITFCIVSQEFVASI